MFVYYTVNKKSDAKIRLLWSTFKNDQITKVSFLHWALQFLSLVNQIHFILPAFGECRSLYAPVPYVWQSFWLSHCEKNSLLMLTTIRVDLYDIRTCEWFFLLLRSQCWHTVFFSFWLLNSCDYMYFFVLVDIHKVLYGLAHFNPLLLVE